MSRNAAQKAELLDRLKANLAEQAKAVAELELWIKAELQGIEPETVAGFTFREDLLTPADKRKYRKATVLGFPMPFDGYYNAVRLKDNTIRKLDPMIAKP